MTNNAIAALLTLACVAFAIWIVGARTRDALKTGELPYTNHVVRAARQPVAFWLSIAFGVLCVALLVAIGILAVGRLASAV